MGREVRREQGDGWDRQKGMEHMPGAAARRRGAETKEHVSPREPGRVGPFAGLRIVPGDPCEIQRAQWSPWRTEVEP